MLCVNFTKLTFAAISSSFPPLTQFIDVIEHSKSSFRTIHFIVPLRYVVLCYIASCCGMLCCVTLHRVAVCCIVLIIVVHDATLL